MSQLTGLTEFELGFYSSSGLVASEVNGGTYSEQQTRN